MVSCFYTGFTGLFSVFAVYFLWFKACLDFHLSKSPEVWGNSVILLVAY